MRPEVFSGEDAERAARIRHEELSVSWAVTLFRAQQPAPAADAEPTLEQRKARAFDWIANQCSLVGGVARVRGFQEPMLDYVEAAMHAESEESPNA